MDCPLLTVLMAGLADRPWQTMVKRLREQIHASNLFNAVEVLYDVDRGEIPSGAKRQTLLNQAKGKYVAFVDDDDLVSDEYLARLHKGCQTDADVISFNLKMMGPNIDETWRFGLFSNARRRDGYFPRPMMVNHLCAWKRDIALRVAWCPDLGYGDDELWFRPLIHSGAVETTYHVDKVLYQYNYHPNVTCNQRAEVVAYAREYVGNGLQCFFGLNKEIWLEVGNTQGKLLRNRYNCVRRLESFSRVDPLSWYYTHKLG